MLAVRSRRERTNLEKRARAIMRSATPLIARRVECAACAACRTLSARFEEDKDVASLAPGGRVCGAQRDAPESACRFCRP